MLPADAAVIFADTLPFWMELNGTFKNMLLSGAKEVVFSKGQTIHRQEQECVGVLIVLKGSIRIYVTSEDGREVTLYRLGKNDVCVLSASCILQHIDFDVSIEAECDCSAIMINSAVFARVCAENVYAELYMYKLAADRFSDVMWAMQRILFTRFDKRLAGFLLDEYAGTGSPHIRMTHELIAKQLGTAREVVSRMLKYFETEGYVSLARGDITVCDKVKLRSVL